MSVPVGVWIGPQVYKFEQVFSDDHQMSVVGGRSHVWYPGMLGPNASWVMVTCGPPEQNDRQTPVKTLPSRNFVFGRQSIHFSAFVLATAQYIHSVLILAFPLIKKLHTIAHSRSTHLRL